MRRRRRERERERGHQTPHTTHGRTPRTPICRNGQASKRASHRPTARGTHGPSLGVQAVRPENRHSQSFRHHQTDLDNGHGGKLQDTHPWEARMWMEIIHGQQLSIIPAAPAAQHPIHFRQTNGVRQGSPASPILFSLKAGQILDNAFGSQATAPTVQGQPAPPHGGGQLFMDDTYLWATSLPRLQSMTKDVEQRLETNGVRIQPEKTQFIESHADNTPSKLAIGGQTIQAKPPDTAISVLNHPVSFCNNETHLAAHLVTKNKTRVPQTESHPYINRPHLSQTQAHSHHRCHISAMGMRNGLSTGPC